jgi:hypothetical protein
MAFRPREKAEWILAGLLLASLPLVTPRIAESDAIEYYAYLRSLVFDGDLDFTNEYTFFYREDPEGRRGFKETFLDLSTATGLKINFGPLGSALLWSPFYLVAHGAVLLARALGAELAADGYSLPYRWAVAFASWFYAAVGLLLSYRVARRYASSEASFRAVAALWWASPVAYYMYIAPGMSHAASLFAAAVFFALWPWVERGGLGRWAVWGGVAGLMALVREQDGLLALAAPLAAFSGAGELRLRDGVQRLAVFGLTALLVFSPQLAVYQVLYGHPSPAPQVQNKMTWSSPHFLQVLFSPEHGLFFWSPALVLFLAGAALLFRRQLGFALGLALAFLGQVYIAGAIESWTAAGAFGARRFLATTVIFAPWGALVLQALGERLRRGAVWTGVAFLMLWNVGLMVQFGLGIMNRQKLVWREVAYNQLFVVPARVPALLEKYLLERDALAGAGTETR